MPTPVHYLPLVTTVLSALFALSLYRRWRRRGAPHLWWWAFGITTYGLGTAIESTITLTGNTVWLTKTWYIAGALLGGYPLAQGSLYLSWPRPLANKLTAASLSFVIVASLLVVLSPANISALDPVRPSGAVLGWNWIRLLTPFINLYAVFFLIGGAIRSAWKHYHERRHFYRAAGNSLIAFGAILPGIGGSFAKAGMVEVLYIGECIGLIFIWAGDRVCSRQDKVSRIPGSPILGSPSPDHIATGADTARLSPRV
jgi:hypothetical protein